MKSPNNQTEESLRKMMSQRFEAYEKEPSPQLTQSVFDQLHRIRRHRTTQILLAGLLLLCIGIVGRLLYVNKQKQGKKTDIAVTHIRSAQKQFAATAPESEPLKSPVSEIHTPDPTRNVGVTVARKVAASGKQPFITRKIPDWANVQSPSDSRAVGQTIVAERRSQAQYSNELPSVLDSKPVSMYETDLMLPEPVGHIEQNAAGKPERDAGYTLLIGLVPTNSFQMLDVIPQAGLIYQNFRFAKLASRQSLGYKFQVGIERKGVQLLINYTQFSHSVTYDVAGSEFILVRDAQNGASPVRKTTTIHDENSVRQLGFALKKHLLVRKGALKMHYFDLGAEFAKQLDVDSHALWLNASFGKEIPIAGRTSLAVGPYIEYSLQKVKNASRVYRSTPYQVGVSVGLRLPK